MFLNAAMTTADMDSALAAADIALAATRAHIGDLQPHKLVSRKGTLLGTVTMPRRVEIDLYERGGVRFYVMPPLRYLMYSGEDAMLPATVRVGAIYWTYHGELGDVVMLDSISVEEWEKIPDHTFAPSAAYLRSLLE